MGRITTSILTAVGGATALHLSRNVWRRVGRSPRAFAEEAPRAREAAVQHAYRDRFGTAVSMLGNAEPVIALAGVYALANLADDWSDGAQQCLDLLCGRLRLPWPTLPDGESHVEPPSSARTRPASPSDVPRGEHEIRTAIVRAIAQRLSTPDPTPEDPEHTAPGRWSHLDLDFTGAVLPLLPFNRAHFEGRAWFGEVTFTRYAGFAGATFTGDVTFHRATFSSGGWFEGATFPDETSFCAATFAHEARFRGTTFNGEVWFTGATFTTCAWFDDAVFLGPVWIDETVFAVDHERVVTSFMSAMSPGDPDRLGVRFHGATFRQRAMIHAPIYHGEPFDLHALIERQASSYPPPRQRRNRVCTCDKPRG